MTDNTDQAALTIAGKPGGTASGEMDVAAALIYDSALSTGSNNLGGNHAAVSQYLFDKYLSTAALPVELIEFRARVNDQESFTDLFWTTNTEEDNDYFEVQRSEDGVAFVALDRVPGAGTSKVFQHYTFQDRQPKQGTNYYRLRQVDFGGAVAYSKVVSVVHDRAADAGSLQLAPNPTLGELSILIPGQERETVVSLHDLTGREIRRWRLSENTYRLTVDVSDLARGAYIVRAVAETSSQAMRLVKQ
jgi:hypothetical protein